MRSQKGNMVVIIGVIIVIVIAVGAFAVFHKSSKNNTQTNNASSSTNQTSVSSNASTKTPAAASVNVIQTKTDAKLGQYLADTSGNPLYTYGGDTNGVSNCSGSCLYSWPIYQASGSTTSLPTNVTVITRSDGTKQYAYKGMPLYTFSSDSSGQVTGDGVSNFHIAKP